MKTNAIYFIAKACTFTLSVVFLGCAPESEDTALPVTTAAGSTSALTAADLPAKTFQPEDIAEIKKLLQDLDSTDYRVVLPVMEASRKTVGTQTYGSYPITEVRRIASLRNIRYTDSGNLQAIFRTCSGGGAGSHTESGSGATGRVIISRIEEITRNMDKQAYILIK
jgi:hypothetical protein